MKLQSLLLALTTISTPLLAAPFTPGDLVIYRVGDGSAALSSASTAVFLDEYSPAGTLIQSIPMPTADAASNHALTSSGSATSEGLLNLSSNGQYVTLTGYDAAPGTASIASSVTTAVPRVIGVVDSSGNINTSTTTTSFSGNNIRSAVSTNGTDIWATGAATGVVYTTLGASGPGTVVSSSATNLRAADIYGGQLYADTGSGTTLRMGAVGSGTPTTAGNTITPLPGFPLTGSPYQFVFADLSPLVAGFDTLYVADDSAGSGLQKYSLVGGSWQLTSTIAITSLRGLTGLTAGTTETLYGTSNGTSLIGFTDTTGYNQAMVGTPITLATAATNTAFRGIDFVPSLAAVPEPATWAMMVSGVGLLLGVQRLRRRRS